MSGGVDSSVAAALLKEQGYEVVGVFMRLGSVGDDLEEQGAVCRIKPTGDRALKVQTKVHHQGCCSVGDANDARVVAAELGISLYVCNFTKEFGRIIDYFTDEYAHGKTPNPCVRCNDWIKFGRLFEYADMIGADFVATGHYAQLAHIDGEPVLKRGADVAKDQSYVLFGIDRARLQRMMLPVGQFEKPMIRQRAHELNLPVFDKPDSQEICFVPDNNYANLVERRVPELAHEGTILDIDGNEIGTHAGHHRFTIGQRRKLGMAFGKPTYVVDKNPASNTITVGDKTDLVIGACDVGEANWLVDTDCMRDGAPVTVQYRAHGEVARATLRLLDTGSRETHSGRTGRFSVVFDDPRTAVAPGQAMVVYGDGEAFPHDRVLGGGWIERTHRPDRVVTESASVNA
ncbi:MAG: tRNA 2-thiouridine(34) synthase MnmA [Phycisphaeraceae bacterium]|nr:tRNA 2-thiouridine(34) synthase MnmA [Phycisphaeraceae bacterium]